MRNLDSHTISSLNGVSDDKNFIMVIDDPYSWVDILQGTRKEIFVKLIDIFHIEEDEFDNMSDIITNIESLNGDGYPLVKIYTL